MKWKKIISLLLFAVMMLSVTPISAYAQSSIGSTSQNTSIGEDQEQGAKTEYLEVEEGNASTEVYLTVEDSELIVNMPTTIILNGTPDKDGNYIGDYSIGVSGNMSGNKVATVEPENYTVALNQKGKNNSEATITQEKTKFDTNDFANNTVTTGNVIATGLTAGSWNGEFNWLISLTEDTYYTTSRIEYFTWGADTEFIEAYNAGDISEWKGVTESEAVDGCSYDYPLATGITGLTDAGIQWLMDNGGNLILPTSATEICDNTSEESAFGRYNRTYGHEINNIIKSVQFSDSIKYIGDYAFTGLESIKELNTNQVEKIGKNAFLSCNRISVVDFNNVLRSVGVTSFSGMHQLRTVIGANAITEIQNNAFCLSPKLEKVISLSNCETIGSKAFYYCPSLSSIGLNEDVIKSIGTSAFFITSIKYTSSDFENCKVGTDALPLDYTGYMRKDYKYSPCVNEISGFSQDNPLWADELIGGTDATLTFSSAGCGWCCDAAIYNYFYGTDFTPVDIVNYLKSTGNSSLIGSGMHSTDVYMYRAFGLNAIKYNSPLGNNPIVTDSYQSIFDTISQGGLVVVGSQCATPSTARHAFVIYGVTDDGKVMVATSAWQSYSSKDPDYPQHPSDCQYFTIPVECFIKTNVDGWICITRQ